MKKEFWLVKFLLMFFVTFALCGCSKKSEVNQSNSAYYDNSDNIMIDVTASTFGFDIAFLTEEKINSVYLASYSGTGLDYENTQYFIYNNSLDLYSDYKYKGLYCSDWMIEFSFPDNSSVSIDSIALSINGEKRVVTFDNPLKYSNVSSYEYIINDVLYATNFPNEFSSAVINSDQVFTYEFEAAEACVLREVEMEGPLDIDIEGIMVNDLDVDGLSDGISLSQGDKLTMNLSYHGKELNECSYVMGDFILTYDIDNTEKQSTAVVVFNPLSPMDNKLVKLKTFADYIIAG